MIAVPSSSGVALGISSVAETVSEKIGRTSNAQPGQIAGAAESRFADRMPATKVPCEQAMLVALVQVLPILPGISPILSLARSG